MQHYREIDILRGIAIILVILGHAIIVYPVNLMNVVWCKSVFSFTYAHFFRGSRFLFSSE